jgi:hypothetical protein
MSIIESYVHSSNKQNTYLKINDITYICSYVNDKIIRNKNYMIRNTNDENILYLYFIDQCIENYVTLTKHNEKISFTKNTDTVSNLSYCDTIKYYKRLDSSTNNLKTYFTIELNYDNVDDLFCVNDLPIDSITHKIDYEKNKHKKYIPVSIPIATSIYISLVKSTRNNIYVHFFNETRLESYLYNCDNMNGKVMFFDVGHYHKVTWIVTNDTVNRKYIFTFIN